jgi:hypothetical protein
VDNRNPNQDVVPRKQECVKKAHGFAKYSRTTVGW